MAIAPDAIGAWRQFRREPFLNGLIVVVLALGIAATVAMFTVVRAVVLAPLPFAAADRLVMVETHMTGPDIAGGFSSYPDFLDWRARARTFERMGAYAAGTVNLTGAGEPAIAQVGFVSDDLLPMLGPSVRAGALFPSDADRKGLPVVILAERFWRGHFGADSGIVGRAITLDDKPYTVVGILGASFQFPIQPDGIDAWIPIGSHPSTAQYVSKRGAGFLHVVGRLRPDASIAAARAELEGIARQLAREYPQSNASRVLSIGWMREELVRDYRQQLLLLLAASALVLLTGCANVAHLLVTRALARCRELAIRAALGAGVRRLAAQLLTESLLLAVAGGISGTSLAWWAIEFLRTRLPTYIPRLSDAHIDGVVLVAAIAVTLGTGVLFGVVPALRFSRPDASDALRQARGSSGSGTGALRFVVVAEVALSLLLLATAGLLVRSLVALQHVDPGFRPDHVSIAELSLPDTRYSTPAAQSAFASRLAERLAGMPGITSAAIGTTLPLSGQDLGAAFAIDGRKLPTPNGYAVAPYYSVSPGFFSTLGIALVKGRLFTPGDTSASEQVVIISSSLAAKFFPGEDPIGKRLKLGFGAPVLRDIVGVVGDVKQRELGQALQPQFYTPFAQIPWPFLDAVVRTTASPDVGASALRRAIADVDPDQPPGAIVSMNDYVARSTATPSVTASVIAVFAGCAALLAAVGLYGVMAHAVARRRRELGIRLALGAPPRALGLMVMREAMTLCALGIAAGLAGAVLAAPLIRALLYRVPSTDPLTFGSVAAGVAVVMAMAALPSALRSAHADPLEVMRAE